MVVHKIKEYGKIRCDEDFPNHAKTDSDIAISAKSFNSIWNYILEFQSANSDIEQAFKLASKNGKRVIQAQNYVGLIETAQKEIVEIYPKIYSSGHETNIEECKRIFLKMIATLKDAPFINIQNASLEVINNFPLLEIFIQNFINEVEGLVLKGLKKNYTKLDANSGFLKGQLLFSQNLIHNLVDHSRFYIRYAVYHADIPQNRLLKSALNKLKNLTTSVTNRGRIQNLISVFEPVKYSSNINADLRASGPNSRLFVDYHKALTWAEIFLLDQSFTTFSGKNINQAMLFPMERLFESYIAFLFKKYGFNHKIYTQHRKFFLINKHKENSRFRLKPDLYAEAINENHQCYVLDTKWKIIDQELGHKNYLISQNDMYQLYAYGRKYIKDENDPKLVLIYPKNKSFDVELAPFYYETKNGSDYLELIAIPFDLMANHQQQIELILRYATGQVNANKE